MSVATESVRRLLSESVDVLSLIDSGEYTIHGGVIRHAAGTEKGGQIVGHLKFPSDPQKAQESIASLQNHLQKSASSLEGGMDKLQQSMNALQGLQMANLALSGLNLAVSAAGFVIVCKKLDVIGQQIQRQSVQINQALIYVIQNHERNILDDEAEFRTLVISAKQFCALGDVEQLRSLLPRLTKQYEFTKLILQKFSVEAASNIDHFNEISLLQDRLTNLGLLLSHVQLNANAPSFASAQLRQLSSDLATLNQDRISALSKDQTTAFRMPKEKFSEVLSLLARTRDTLPALAYEAELIELEMLNPTSALAVPECDEIIFLAAA